MVRIYILSLKNVGYIFGTIGISGEVSRHAPKGGQSYYNFVLIPTNTIPSKGYIEIELPLEYPLASVDPDEIGCIVNGVTSVMPGKKI